MTTTPIRRSFLGACAALLGLVALGLGATACGSTGGGRLSVREDVPPLRVVFRDYRSGLPLTLVNDAWLVQAGYEGTTPAERKVSYQSRPVDPNAAWTKITSDADLDLYVRGIESELKLGELFQSGPAGETSGVYTTAIEVTEGTAVRHIGNGPGINNTLAQKQNYRTACGVFVEMYNYNYSLQAVDDPFGGGLNR
jgi:hypothetical protein